MATHRLCNKSMPRAAILLCALFTLMVEPRAAIAGQGASTLGDKAKSANIRVPDPARASVETFAVVAGRRLRTVAVPLNHTGIVDANFLNPRNPPDLLAFDDMAPALERNLTAEIGANLELNRALGLTAETVKADLNTLKTTCAMDQTVAPSMSVCGLSALRLPDLPDDVRTVLQAARDRLRLVEAERVRLRFENRTSDQALVVSFSIFEPEDLTGGSLSLIERQARLQRRLPALHVGTCQKAGGAMSCAASITIPPRSHVFVPAELFLYASRDGGRIAPAPSTPIAFQVAFFAENATPAHGTGYFSVVAPEMLTEIASATSWSLAASLSATRAPDFGTTISTTSTYSGGRLAHLPAKGTLTVAPNLGSRAQASIDLNYKKADLGDTTDKGALAASRFQIDIHALNGATLSFGKFAFATPTSSVALDEEGEGFRLVWKNLAVSHIVNRESAAGTADADNHDDKELILELDNLSGRNWRGIESVNVIAMYGRDSFTTAPATPAPATGNAPVAATAPASPPSLAHQYWTLGAEAFFPGPTDRFRTTAAIYHSATTEISDSGAPARSGTVAYLTGTWSFFGDVGMGGTRKVLSTILTQYGLGSAAANDGGLTQAYMGEHQAFAPDSIFFTGLSKKISVTPELGAGLGNKQYVSVAYADQRWSPLNLMARALQIPDRDIASQATTLQWHHYDLRTVVSGPRALGDELDVTFQIETPAGITSQIRASYFRPGDAIGAVVTTRLWALVANVKVKI